MAIHKKLKCPICKKRVLSGANFCTNCRYPINVKKISKFDKNELVIQLSSLFNVIIGDSKPLFHNKELNEIYNELFFLNWLRPETVLLYFIEARILLDFKNKYLKYPILDLGCGEGLFTSILFGARLNKNYDAYEAIDFNKSDVYNAYTKIPKDFLKTKPSPIGFGVDLKENAVLKAKDIKVYDKVKVGDARKLPFESRSVNSVFSNMIDDIKGEDLERVFKEVNRVLKNKGYFVFTTPNERFRKYLFYYNKARLSKAKGKIDKYKFFSVLDMGRSEWESRPLSLWKKLFKKTSFELIQHIEYADKNILQLWDTGFRPFFKYLMESRNILRKNNMLLDVKKIWVEIMKKYFFQYVGNKSSKNGSFSIIVAKKI